jgi:23S rRNA (uracil1939-C5)-methyltransferase
MGVARLDGMAVFVQGALPGERVTARLIKVASSYAVARVQTFEEASPERREPFVLYSSGVAAAVCSI